MFAFRRPHISARRVGDTRPPWSTFWGMVSVLAILLLSACGGREPGPISDIESTDGYSLTTRSEGELWYDVAHSIDGGDTWELKGPERYLPGTALGIEAAENSRAARIAVTDETARVDAGDEIIESPYTQTTELCLDNNTTCWRAVTPPPEAQEGVDARETAPADAGWVGVERTDNGGATWTPDFRITEGRERFAPDNYPSVVDMALITSGGEKTVVAVTAEHGLLMSSAPGEWMRGDVMHWSAPSLDGNWMLAWPEFAAIAAASAVALAVLFALMHALTRRAHEQVGQSLLSIITSLSVVPLAYYATLPIIDWTNGTISDRADAVADARAAATLWGLVALVVVVVLSLAVRYRWSRRLGALPFPDTPA